MPQQLARQIHVSLLGSVALSVVAFALFILVTSHQLEHSLLDTLVNSEADVLTNQLREREGAQPKLPTYAATSAWLSTSEGDGTPAPLNELPLGITHDVRLNGRKYHVLRRPMDEGTLTVAVNIEALERRELTLQLSIIGGGLAIIVLLLVVGRAISRRVAGPLQKLANELDQLDPSKSDPTPLADRYHGAEAHTIAEALDRYVNRLSELVERERSFSSSASHELRSPVSVISNSLELMQMDKQLPDHLRSVAERAQRGAKRLGEVLDGLMLLARDQDSDNVTRVDAHALLQELIADLPQNGRNVVLLAPDQPVLVLANESHLRMLVSNLIRNAFDHASGQPVTVQLNSEELAVEDNGPGISLQVLPHVFERNQRGRESTGAGLGLYIAAEISRRHGWSIEASNRAPQGCRIRVGFRATHHE